MNSYQILPFSYHKLNNFYLLTNDIGEFVFLSETTFSDFIHNRLSKQSKEYCELEPRLFVTNDPIDETLIKLYSIRLRTKKQFIFESTSLHMIIITHRCNQSCKYCHASASSQDNTTDIDLDIQTAAKIIDFILTSPSKYLKIEFQGGEPTLNFAIIQFIVEYANTNKTAERNIEYVLCSNLFDLSEEQINFCIQNKISISTSLDGTENIHNSCRLTNSEKGTFERVTQNIQKIRDMQSEPSALLTVTKYSLERLNEVIMHYISSGFKSIFIRSLNPYGEADKNIDSIHYSEEEFIHNYINALEFIIELNRKGIDFIEEYASILLVRILTPFSSGFVDLQSPTGAAICGLIYDTAGNIFASDESRMIYRMSSDNKFLLGNVFDNTRESVFTSPKVEELLSNSIIESEPYCAWCAYQTYCGSDPVRNYFETGKLTGNQSETFLCKKNKAIFDFIFSKLKTKDPFILDLFSAWARGLTYSEIKS